MIDAHHDQGVLLPLQTKLMKTGLRFKKRGAGGEPPGRRRYFRHFRVLFSSNPPSGIFGFYPGRESACSS
jgi:hypothetical protein